MIRSSAWGRPCRALIVLLPLLLSSPANYLTNPISGLAGNGDGTFGVASTYAAGGGPASVVADDVNGDGKLDLVVANFLSTTVSVLLGNGNGTFQPARNFAAGPNPSFA